MSDGSDLIPAGNPVDGWPFTDLVSGEECRLVVREVPGRGGVPFVVHVGCDRLADAVPVLDAFYCRYCRWSGRVSGAWVMDMLAGGR